MYLSLILPRRARRPRPSCDSAITVITYGIFVKQSHGFVGFRRPRSSITEWAIHTPACFKRSSRSSAALEWSVSSSICSSSSSSPYIEELPSNSAEQSGRPCFRSVHDRPPTPASWKYRHTSSCLIRNVIHLSDEVTDESRDRTSFPLVALNDYCHNRLQSNSYRCVPDGQQSTKDLKGKYGD